MTNDARLIMRGSDERAVRACRAPCPSCGAPAGQACALPDRVTSSSFSDVLVCRARLAAAPGTSLGLAPRPRPLEGERP